MMVKKKTKSKKITTKAIVEKPKEKIIKIEEEEIEEKIDNVEIKNAIEEMTEILDGCVKCGMCKSLCPVFRVLREEGFGPRGKSIFLSKKMLNEVVWQCTLCKACEKKCPLNLKVWEAVRKAREALVLQGKELEQNKDMIKNIRETGNPFGKNPDDKGKLYCC